MANLRTTLGAIALGVILLLPGDGSAQPPASGAPPRGLDRGAGRSGSRTPQALPPLTSPCPSCEKIIEPPADKPASFDCPHCKSKINVEYNPDGYTLTVNESNKYQKWLIYGGVGLFVVGVIGVLLKNTVFAAAKPKKKRRDDDDEDDD